jgi:hypothetical protein
LAGSPVGNAPSLLTDPMTFVLRRELCGNPGTIDELAETSDRGISYTDRRLSPSLIQRAE